MSVKRASEQAIEPIISYKPLPIDWLVGYREANRMYSSQPPCLDKFFASAFINHSPSACDAAASSLYSASRSASNLPGCAVLRFFCEASLPGIAYLKREKRPSEMLHMGELELKCDSRIHHIMFADWRPSQVCEHLLNEAYRILRLIVVRYVLPNSARSSDPHSF